MQSWWARASDLGSKTVKEVCGHLVLCWGIKAIIEKTQPKSAIEEHFYNIYYSDDSSKMDNCSDWLLFKTV